MVKRPLDRGFALLLALAVLLMVAAAVLLAFRTAVSGKNAVQRERRLIELRAASDAALAKTMAALEESSASAGFAEQPFAGAILSSRITRRPDDTLEVAATATRNGWGMTLTALVMIDRQGRPSILSWTRSPARQTSRGTVSELR